MKNDEPIDEIREIRQQISGRMENDPDKLVAYYIKLQQHYQERLIPAPAPESKEPTAA